ncbi:MAG: NAD-dependent protein deacylase [Nitrososphaeria archaeon]
MSIERVAEAILRGRCTVALTGAGISTASGIRDFRGPQGIWKTIDPEKFEINYFMNNPDEVWSLFINNFALGEEVRPNDAHLALAELENMGLLCGVMTQNIDGLHQKAGSHNVIELHGSLERAVCIKCRKNYALKDLIKSFTGKSPVCPSCGGILKPDIIFFGEPLNQEVIAKAVELSKASDVFLAIGTSLSVSPANQLPLYAKLKGAKLIILNEGPTEEDELADIIIRGRVESILPEIVKIIRSKKRG